MSDFSGEVHPFAAAFPMLPDDELDELAADIAANGQLHPILISPGGVLLDGRNRLEGCTRAGVQPKFETYEGDPITLIVSANVNRRSLTTAQKAAARAKALGPDARYTDKGGQRRWKRKSWADKSNADLSKQVVADVGHILDHDSALLDRVILGDSLADVLAEVEKQQAERDAAAMEAAQLLRRIEALTAAGYMERVSDGALTLDEAWTLCESETAIARRIDALPTDLAEKVRDGMSLDEAEEIAAGAAASFQRWLEKVALSLKTLGRMVGYPIPNKMLPALTEQYGEPYAKALESFLDALGGVDCALIVD